MTAKVALLHGFSGGPASFDEVVRALGATVTAVRPALLGHGASGDRAVTTFEGEVDRLAAALRGMGSGFHLVGYSLGGRVALGLLVRHPDLFRSATLVSLSPGLADDAERPPRRAQDARLIEILERRGIDAFVDVWEALPLFESQRRLSPDRLVAQRAARLSHDPRELARSLRVTGLAEMPSYWDALPAVTVPVGLVGGELDVKFRAILAAMQGRLPNATLEIVPDAGHNVLLERPDVLVSAIQRALGAP